MSKFSDFLSTKKIDPRRLVSASKGLETRTDEDRALVAKKALIKAGKAEKDEATQKAKPRSGRPVTLSSVEKAVRGDTITGPTKTRIVRALNAVLTQKKQGEIALRDVF